MASVSVVFSTGSDLAFWRYLGCLPALTPFGSDPFPATVICAVRIGSLIGRRSLPTIAYCTGFVLKLTIWIDYYRELSPVRCISTFRVWVLVYSYPSYNLVT